MLVFKRQIQLIALSVVVLLNLSYVRSQVFGYHPNSPLFLSGSFDTRDISRITVPCITHNGEVAVGANATSIPNAIGAEVGSSNAPSTIEVAPQQILTEDAAQALPVRGMDFSLSLINSREQLYKQLNIDASISARFAFGGGSGSFSLEESLGLERNDVVWVLRGRTDYGNFTLRNPELTDEAKQLVGDLDSFYTKCGTHFISQERRQATIAVIFVAHNVDQEERSRLEASFSANGSFFGGSYSASFNLRKFYEFASSVASTSIHVMATGGPGITVLSPLVDSPTNAQGQPVDQIYQDLDLVRRTISNYIKSLDQKNVVATHFYAASYETLDPTLKFVVPDLQDFVLSELFFAFTDYTARLQQIHALLRSQAALDAFTTEQQVTIGEEYNALVEAVTKTREYADACLAFSGPTLASSGDANVGFEPLPPVTQLRRTIQADEEQRNDSEQPVSGECTIPAPYPIADLPDFRPVDLYINVVVDEEVSGNLTLTVRHPNLLAVRILEERILPSRPVTFYLVTAEDLAFENFPPGAANTAVTKQSVIFIAESLMGGLENLYNYADQRIIEVSYGSSLEPDRLRIGMLDVLENEGYLVRSPPPDTPTP